MGRRGPAPVQIDWSKVTKMAHIQCTAKEIASVFDICADTLANACKRDHGIKLSDYLKQKAEGGKMSLRRMQWKNARGGNVAMQIWLGKQYLGQEDKSKQTTDATVTQRGQVTIYMPDNGRDKK